MIPLSLYIHIPFCRERCSYCAFNTYADMADAIPSYVGALLREVSLVGSYPSMQGQAIHTIYLGGGTPSLLSGKQVGQILTTCRHYFGVMDDTEISLEANPGTIDADKLHAYREAGVNRLSLGVQSAHARDLELFGRLHDFDEAGEAFRQGRAAGFEHINVDLIYGIPYQTFAEWQTTLDCVLDWKPDHMSLYSLSLEPGTPLRQQVQVGQHPYPDPDLAADMYDCARERLAAAGLIQYELSNWARAGFECRHNRQYWLDQPFLGLGAGAHGSINGVRYWNARLIPDYISRITNGFEDKGEELALTHPVSPALYDFERLDRSLEMADTLILGLRLVREGVRREDFRARFGLPTEEAFGKKIAGLIDEGWLVDDGQAIRLAERAYLLSNQIFTRLLPDDMGWEERQMDAKDNLRFASASDPA